MPKMTRARRSAIAKISSKKWRAKNDRRYQLIVTRDRTPEEDKELEILQKEVFDEINLAYPRPPLPKDS